MADLGAVAKCPNTSPVSQLASQNIPDVIVSVGPPGLAYPLKNREDFSALVVYEPT